MTAVDWKQQSQQQFDRIVAAYLTRSLAGDGKVRRTQRARR